MTRRLAVTLLLLAFTVVRARAQTITTFEGMDASKVAAPEFDIDPNGAVGTKQFMEWVNPYFQAWDKQSWAPVWSAPQAGSSPFTANGNANCSQISGDGVVIFDRLASRWVIAAHNSGSTNYYYCVAISNTDDLTSSTLAWFTYAIPLNKILGFNTQGVTYFPDWPKIATWADAYYVAMDLEDPSNKFQEVGVLVCALDRTNMLIGGTPNTPQCFNAPSTISGAMVLAHSFQPADVEGTTAPPAGAPEYFASIANPVNDGVTTTSTSFNLYQFHVNWTTPSLSTFTQSTVSAATYTPGCYLATAPVNTICVPEASTSSTGKYIDSVGDRFMFRFAYRNFGNYQSYLVSHTVQVGTGNGSQTGIRWYELRGSGTPALFQSGTINPDQSLYRFMPSIAQDQSGNAAVGYSVSSSSTHPGISASWWSLANQTHPTEVSLYSGNGDEENQSNWGDYTSMTVDPVDNCTFWYVNEYFAANQTTTPNWNTRISNFNLPTCGPVTLTPSPLSYGSHSVGTTSVGQQLTLKNGETGFLSISSVALGGANPGDFKQSNNCGAGIAQGATCTISVVFAPTAIGSRSATLSVTDSATNTPQMVTMSGTATAPVTLSAATLNFGTVFVKTSKTAAAITLTNHMSVALIGVTVGITGATSFTQTNTCGTSVPARGTCTITVTFSPTVPGKQTGTVNITDSAVNSPQTIALTGTGKLPVVVTPLTLSFGTVTVGTTSAAKTVTVTNNLSTALSIGTINFTGANPGDFAQSNTCGTSLASLAKCTISVTFTPKATGTRAAALNINDSANTSPQKVNVSGTGQ
jgi:hypothetical protein